MRFLIDAQLPPALAQFLTDLGHWAEHVVDVGLKEAEDDPITLKAFLKATPDSKAAILGYNGTQAVGKH